MHGAPHEMAARNAANVFTVAGALVNDLSVPVQRCGKKRGKELAPNSRVLPVQQAAIRVRGVLTQGTLPSLPKLQRVGTWTKAQT